MIFRQLASHGTRALAYLVADADTREAAAIDPRPEHHAVVLALLDERGLRLAWVLRTHTHAGDDDKAAVLCRRAGATLAGPGSRVRSLRDGDLVAFGAEMLRVLSTPGHTPDSVCYLCRDRLFSGDALAIGGCDPVSAPEAEPAQLYDSVIRKLFTLPGETLVFPSHAYHGRHVSTIDEERAHNRWFALRSRDAFVAAYRRRQGERTPEHGVAARGAT